MALAKEREDSLRNELDARFRKPLMNFFFRRVGERSTAEDLTQETFVRLLGSHSFLQADQVNAFVFRVASNLLKDRHRQRVRRGEQHGSVVGIGGDLGTSYVAEDITPERVLIARERLDQVIASLEELGERTKHIFVLFQIEGLRQKEIAARYGLGLSTVEKHIIRASLHLAKRFSRKHFNERL